MFFVSFWSLLDQIHMIIISQSRGAALRVVFIGPIYFIPDFMRVAAKTLILILAIKVIIYRVHWGERSETLLSDERCNSVCMCVCMYVTAVIAT